MVSLTPKPAGGKKTKPRFCGTSDSSDSSSSGDECPLPYYKTHWNLWSCFLYLLFICAWGFYFFVRARYTIPRNYAFYSWIIYGFELVGSSNMFVHCLYMLRRRKYYQPDDRKGMQPLIHDYHVRALVPCYRESLELVQQTVLALLEAHLPSGCQRTVYLCDDGKDPAKEAWVMELGRADLVYVSGRVRATGEINGKSANLNYALNRIYPRGSVISMQEVLAVFDADQVAATDFFTRTLPWLQDGTQSIVLTPQFFHNYNTGCDIFNHRSATYWNLILPGQDAWGIICCTGSNMLIRAAHCAEVNWFPTYTMGEDTALALELQCRGRTGVYIREKLAVGEVPTELRAVCLQKSRWCKGNMQIYFDIIHCPLFRHELTLWERILWIYGAWGYITNILTTPIFLLVPVVGVVCGIVPVVNSTWFAIAFSAYIASIYAVIYLGAGSLETSAASWFTNNANTALWWLYGKSTWNVIWGCLGGRQSTFKATPKTAAAISAVVPVEAAAAAPTTPQPKVHKRHSGGAKGALGDLWMPALIVLVLSAAIGIGIWQLVTDGIIRSTWNFGLLVSLCWCIFNLFPFYLMLHYAAVGEFGLTFACWVSKLLMLFTGGAVIALLWWLRPKEYGFSKVLEDSILFFESRRSGVLPADNRVPWRGDSGLSDYMSNGTTGIRLVGGYYDLGTSFVKHSYPIAAATSLLCWGLLTFPEGFTRSNQTGYAEAAIKWGADYLITAHYAPTSFVAQIGDPTIDGSKWTRPEQLNETRPVFVLNSTRPGSDLLGSAAAALAASALAYKDANRTWSVTAGSHAVQLYKMATKQEGLYAEWVQRGGVNLAGPYVSGSYLDDLAWAATWLYKLTNDPTYLQDAAVYYKRHFDEEVAKQTTPPYVFDWQNVAPGAALLLAEATNFRAPDFTVDHVRPDYLSDVHSFQATWMQRFGGENVTYTPQLLAWSDTSAPLAAAANAAFLAEVYAERHGSNGIHTCWAETQARYMLGLRGKRSYVVGAGKKPPTQPADRAASCPISFRTPCTRQNALLPDRPNPHTLNGALVNGPDKKDHYSDSRTNSNSGASITNNAGFTGLMAALAQQPSDHWSQCTTRVKFFWRPSNYYLF